ncbi:DUF3431 domain-containing protein [Desulfovibrio inopinatus]|uniref:DUF3431 domain-containing protein n=1 Tax=Desulfovibrio inopinatus TaxID=102109 RepID=UPI0004260301|nr:DUF3431 domain-containing protein [Desulfovibrio inopinatus]
MNSRVCVVVAKYNEDVSWTKALPCDVLIYDKSGKPGPLSLPNIGRESHTYLHHIVSTYPNFPDAVVFVQADPFFHMDEPTPEAFYARVEQNMRLGVAFTGFANYKLKCDRFGQPHNMHGSDAGKWAGAGRDIPVGALYERLFAGNVPDQFLVSAPAGLLYVRRDRILARPKALYQCALETVIADPDDAANTGHAFERLWPIIFNGKTTLNKPQYDACSGALHA